MARSVTITALLLLIQVSLAVYRYGDVTKGAAFPCRCTEGCNPDNGTCISGRCQEDTPPGHRWKGDGCRIGNVAFRKAAFQGKTYGGLGADLAIDGRIGPGRYSDQCAYPYFDDRARWGVDLRSVHVIYNITLYNMNDSYYQTLSDFVLTVGNYSFVGSNPVCINKNRTAVPRGGNETFTCPTPMYGRYVGFRRNERTAGTFDTSYATICEFVATGRTVVDCRNCPSSSSCDDYNGCAQCQNGTLIPDCSQGCAYGRWGINCEEVCSSNCKSPPCAPTNGICLGGCNDVPNYREEEWWIGERCDVLVPAIPEMPVENITLVEITTSSIKIQWKNSFQLTSEVAQYFGYNVYYLPQNESEWLNWGTFPLSNTMWTAVELNGLEAAFMYTIIVSVWRNFTDGTIYERVTDYNNLPGLNITTLTVDVEPPTPPPAADDLTAYTAAGSVVGLVLVALIISAVIILLRRKRRLKPNMNKDTRHMNMTKDRADGKYPGAKMARDRPDGKNPGTLNAAYANYDETSLNSKHGPADEMTDENTEDEGDEEGGPIYENARRSKLVENTCIEVKGLEEYLNKKMNDRDWFKEEFKDLPQGQVLACKTGSTPVNINKNRFKNIKSYDKTRVILEVPEADGTDYINANYITGYGGRKRAYVAAQAPRPETVIDFWNMIWQLQITTVVMLTEIFEVGKKKSELYWPEKVGKQKVYGSVTITAMQIEVYAEYASRKLRISNGDKKLTVHHLQYLGWPDKSVPKETFPLITFRNLVKSLHKNSAAPLLVHCSAGVGRTGSYIAIDYLIEQAKSEQIIDVVQLVTQMRHERMTMIQTLSQYQFVYDAILDASCCGETSIPISKLEQESADLLKLKDQETLRTQFELLSSLRSTNAGGYRAGLSAEHSSKNRDKNIIPGDDVRPHLAISSEYRSDYINAVFINSYKVKHGMIATQTPLAETEGDFWRLVYDHQCGAIVMLENNESQDESPLLYWNNEKEVGQSYGPFEVTLMASRTKGNVKLREFSIQKKASQVVRKAYHFELTSWHSSKDLPNTRALLDLFDQLDACEFKGKVLVHCLNGASRCGLFCAARYMLEKMSVEKEVDVFTAVRHVSSVRPQFVNDLVQYRFLHELASEEHTRHALYANI